MSPQDGGITGGIAVRREAFPGGTHESLMSVSGGSHASLTPDLDQDQDQDQDLKRKSKTTCVPEKGTPALSAEPAPQVRPSSADLESLIAESEKGYPGGLARAARDACARSRSTGRMHPKVWLGVLTKLAGYPPSVVVAAMEVFVDRYSTGEHDEKYLIGIVRNESERANRKKGWHPPTTRDEYAAAATSPQELASMFGNLTDEDRARVERLGMRGPNG